MLVDSLSELDALYYKKIQSAYAESTVKNFKYQTIEYFNFCLAHAYQIYPPVSMNIARYLTACTQRVSAFGTIMNKLSAIKKMYHLSGYEVDASHPIIDLLVKACKRDMSAESKPKAPLEPSHLILINSLMDPSNLDHRIFQAALMIQYFSCVRKSNLLPPSIKGFSQHRHLTRADITVLPDGLHIALPWTKTIQNSDKIMTICIAKVNNSVIDPVSTYEHFISDFPMPARMPAFSVNCGSKILVLTQQNYIQTLKLFLSKLGLPVEAYSSHSIRRGGTTVLYESGASQKQIKAHGGWKSACYERYIEPTYSDKLNPTIKMLKYINKKFSK